jgi:serine-type D-Ala-D-Ala carboxypeptidase/endopeptidase (penicillin-binding protein 4)
VARPTWDGLCVVLDEERVDGCILDAGQGSAAQLAVRIEFLRRAHPDVAIVVYTDQAGELDYYALGEAGVDDILLSHQLDPAHVRTVVDRSLARSRAARVARALGGRFGPIGARAVAWAVEYATDRPTVGQFAAAMGFRPTAFTRELDRWGLPSPSKVLVWGRLLAAGALLGRDRRTVEESAFVLGYSTAGALGRAMKKHTGLTPSEVSARGGMAVVHGRLFPPSSKRKGRNGPLKTLGVAAFLVLHSGCASLATGAAPPLPESIDGILDAPPLDQLHFGVLAVDAATGRTLYARNARRKFVPASNQKLLVTSTALSLLGADYRYTTDVWATGSADGSFLDGDLVLIGSGDPSLSDRYWPSGESALAVLADSLRLSGLEHVAGSIFVDVSSWDSTSVGPSWEVEDLRYSYGSTGGAFALEEGEVTFVVQAGPAVGTPARVRWSPIGTEDFVWSRVTTAPPDSVTRVRPNYLPESRKLVLEGRIGLGGTDTLRFAMRDPVREAAHAFARAVKGAGIEVDGVTTVAWTAGARVGRGCLSGSVRACPNAGRLTGLRSPPLIELVAGILEPSQNWMAEQLTRTLGAERGEEGSWAEGVRVIRDFLTGTVGVDSLDLAPRDGSGLSAYNLVTPRALVRILRYMGQGPDAVAFRQALAEPGEEGSTLARRFSGLEGRVFAKTGTISNVNSLSGYLVRDDGTRIVFSILSNGSGLPSARVRKAIDDVVRILAR